MKNKRVLVLSAFGALCLTSCGQVRYTHSKLNCELKMYSADLNHNGTLEDNEKNLTWAETYDVLLDQISNNDDLVDAADNMGIQKDEKQRTQLARYEIMHELEDMLMDTGTTMTLYNYSDPYLLKPNVAGIYFMGLGTKYLDQLTLDGKADQTFHLSVGTKADTLDPADNNDSSTSNSLNNCMRGLSYYVKNEKEVDGQSRTYGSQLKWNDKLLEKDPEITYDEGKPTYTFKIKPDNKQWSNGESVKALDFIYTWHRACSTYHGSWGFIFDCIEGYEDYTTWINPETEKAETRPQEQQKFWADDPQGEVSISGIKYIDEYTFSVKLNYDCSFFQELCSFTAFAPLCKSKMEGKYIDSDKKEVDIDPRGKDAPISTWWNSADNWVTNGPFKLTNINNKQTGTFDLERNDSNNCLAGSVYETKPKTVIYHLIDDDSAMYMDYQRNRYNMIDSFPSAMTDKVKADLPNDYRVADQIGNYYFFFNVNDNALDITNEGTEEEKEERRANLRKGLVRLPNRLDMVDTIVKSGATDGNGFVSTDITETCYPVLNNEGQIVAARDDKGNLLQCDWHARNKDTYQYLNTSQYKDHWLYNRKPGGYWKTSEDFTKEEQEELGKDELQKRIMTENVNAAMEYFKKAIKGTNVKYDEKTGKFTNFPILTITTNTGTGHEALCERLQYVFGLYGITLRIETQEWTSFSTYIKQGNCAMGRNGWIADFPDARTYLELFKSTYSSNYTQLGKTAKKGAYIHKSQ